jgi:hypothetical protein
MRKGRHVSVIGKPVGSVTTKGKKSSETAVAAASTGIGDDCFFSFTTDFFSDRYLFSFLKFTMQTIYNIV